MSVDSVMTEFNNVIRKNYELEIFDIVIPDADEETGTVPAYFDPETLIEDDICKTIDTAKNTINRAFLYFFNDLEIPNGEHQNFLVLNNISEIFRKTPSYSFTTKEFTDKLEYAYTCGQLYTSYAKGCTGDFLDVLFKHIPVNITSICTKYQQLYDEFIPEPPDTSDPEAEVIPKITQFWNLYSDAFTEEILANKPPFEELSKDFEYLYDKITEYKELGINAAKQQAVGYVFPGDEKRLQVAYPSMDEVFSTCRNKFKLYDTLVDSVYELWLKTITHVEEEYADKQDYEKESLKLKIYSGALLEEIDFFADAQKIYQDFLTFFEQYDIR